MHTFGLEDCSSYARAEEESRRAIALQPLGCWAHHAEAHVMEVQGRAEDGIGWMTAREPYWSGDDNAFKMLSVLTRICVPSKLHHTGWTCGVPSLISVASDTTMGRSRSSR